ncbi:hypothetical protein [Chrysiogenes arsenatis]|nr:hypothetical protein [Chrysiogenes arsenatis]
MALLLNIQTTRGNNSEKFLFGKRQNLLNIFYYGTCYPEAD